MRKVLLTVMMVSSLLAFNACKKDGEQGPAGPAGPTGATGPAGAAGAAGAVGAAGAKGADGTKILSGTVDPVTADGAVGDFYFNKTSKTLWGPKVAAGWAGTSTGLTGPAGNQFLAGAGVPDATAPTNAKTGDFYFDTNTSTFYGPKAADGTWASVVPLSSNSGLKNYVFAKSFETIVETPGARVIGAKATATYSDYLLLTTFKIVEQDVIRVTQYPGWMTNREMVFETSPGSGAFTADLTAFGQLGTAPFTLNSQFKYKNDPSGASFNFTQLDIDRLSSVGATSFGYWNFAAMQSAALGTDIKFARKKLYTITSDPTRFATTYTATTKFDLNTLPGLPAGTVENIKRDGKLYVKYKYFNAKTATGGNTLVNTANTNAGWTDITAWANSYVGATTGGYTNIAGVNPFGGNLMGGGVLGAGGTITFAPAATNNNAVGTMDLVTAGVTDRGRFTIDWTINSGAPTAGVAHTVGDAYYNSASGNLRFVNLAGTEAAVVADAITYNDTQGGLEPAGLSAIKLVQIQVLAIPAANVAAAKAKGVDINNPIALQNFVKL